MPLLPRPAASPSLVVDVARIVGADGVSVADADRLAYARDAWARDVLRLRSGDIGAAPEAVVWPESPDEVARVLQWAARQGVPVVPFGSGSGRVGGARLSRGGIALDLKRIRRIRRLDESNLRLEVEAGIMGARLERSLNLRGYTLGHFPASMHCSTLGGWLATRSAGQMSTKYGKIEDLTLGLEMVSPGIVRRCPARLRPGPGPDWVALGLGSEGCLGALTAAELRIRPLPAARRLGGYRFRSVEHGVEAIRRLLHVGLRPAVVRLYDALDTLLGRGAQSAAAGTVETGLDVLAHRIPSWLMAQGRSSGQAESTRGGLLRRTTAAVLGVPLLLNKALEILPDDCLLVLGFEGGAQETEAQERLGREILMGEGAEDLGPGPGEYWLKHRYDLSFKQSKMFASGLFVDTLEVASTWDRLLPLHRAVRRAIAREAVVMAHFAHAYAEGCSVYFTFTGAAGDPQHPEEALERYDRIWKQALVAVHETGGTIAHHHGVGEAKAAAVPREHGAGGVKLLSALSAAFDPDRILNPGKLGIERYVPPRSRTTGQGGLPRAIAAAVGERNLLEADGRRVVRPPDERALAALLRVAHARGIALTSDQAATERAHAVQLDLSRLEGVSRVSEHSCFVECEAGVLVERLESVLAAHNLTLGPVHPLALTRSVGSALAGNLLVRRSVAYGGLQSTCFAIRALLANGESVETRAVPRSATGPALDRLFVGAGGRFGLITKATLRAARCPRHRESLRFAFRHFEEAVETARRLLREEVYPACARAWPEGEGGELAVDLVAPSPGLLRARTGTLERLAMEAQGRRQTPSPDAAAGGGHFEGAVELEVAWSRCAAVARGVESVTWGRIWVDFMGAEGATVVAQVADESGRRAAAETGLSLGARVLSGPNPARSESDHGHSMGDGRPPLGNFQDIGATLAESLDPGGVLRA